MKTLDLKLLRDLRGMKGQVLAICLIIACGISAWVTVLSAYDGLKGTRDAYYTEYRMAGLFAAVKRAPRSAEERLSSLPGVRKVESRIVFDVTIDLPKIPRPCFGRVQSVPDVRRKAINDLHLTSGRWFEGDGNREVIVGDRFAKEHDLVVGDSLAVVMNNRKESLRIAGTALSPEHVYMIRGAGDVLPDAAHFTVLWFSRSFSESVFDMKDSANEFVALLHRDALLPDVIADFDRELARYGAIGAYGRKDQISHRFLTDEIEGLKGTATFVPAVFLAVAAFVIHMILGRLVRTQRTQLAVFRAFGYSAGDLILHYLKLALLVGVVGAVLGAAVGLWFSRGMLRMYQEFYQFPILRFSFDPLIVLSGVAISLFFAALGAVSATRTVARLRPAEGMRPEAPAVFHRTILERWPSVWRNLGVVWRMVIRNIARSKLRSGLTIGGVALSTSIILLGFFSDDSMQYMMDFQYETVEKQDLRITFSSERGKSALYELRRMEGVRTVEPELMVPVRLRHGRRERRVAIIGIDEEATLRGLVDRHGRRVPVPDEGLVLSDKLAELLGVRPGDEVEVEVLQGRKPKFLRTVEGVVDEYIGTSVYANLHHLARWIGEEESMIGALLLIDPARATALSEELKDLPAVGSVVDKDQTLRNFRETLAASMGIMTGILSLFAGIISFGVIYNASRIGLAERQRTLASMRVLGFTEKEVASILTRENLLLAVLGIGPGLLIGWLECVGMTRLYDSDLYRLPVVFSSKTILITSGLVFVFAVVANLPVGRRIRRLDLVDVLKSRE